MNHQQLKSKDLHRAYYSLVQYCPDLSRLEVANVGVVQSLMDEIAVQGNIVS